MKKTVKVFFSAKEDLVNIFEKKNHTKIDAALQTGGFADAEVLVW